MAKQGTPLTARQQEIWDMRLPVEEGGRGLGRVEIAAILGISVNVVSKALTVIRGKLGIKNADAKAKQEKSTEFKDPERFAAITDAVTEPEALVKLKDALKDAGIPGKSADAYIARLRRRYPGVLGASRALKTAEITDLLSTKIHMALTAMDEHVVQEASFRDLALGATAMIEKRQLLRGEPTQIISDADRKKLHELMPELMKEAGRRGITIDGQVTEKTVSPA